MLPLRTNARAKTQGFDDGFVKVFCRRGTRIVVGGVVVAPHASELIHVLALAVDQRLTVDQLAGAFTVYPSRRVDRRGSASAPRHRLSRWNRGERRLGESS